MNSHASSTLHELAFEEMSRLIDVYLDLSHRTNDFSTVQAGDLPSVDHVRILLAGIGSALDPTTASLEQVVAEFERRKAIPFEIEISITTGVYVYLRQVAVFLLEELEKQTSHFTNFDPEFICDNPHFLPLLQHIGGFFSKAQLKKRIGSVSDTHISKPAAERLADFLQNRVDSSQIRKGEILNRLESTLEGIVRDLVGKLLLESVVKSALEAQKLLFQTEDEYTSLAGVVYDFRADFVIPSASRPKAFIEVRKSSTRHASLYAKDKMFSAINWKGKNRDLLGILVVDGPWTAATLKIMAKVFDYVVPIGHSTQVAKTIAAYLAGDRSKLKWLVDFRISENVIP